MAGSSASAWSSPTGHTGECAGCSAGSTSARAKAWCCGPGGASTPRSCASRSTRSSSTPIRSSSGSSTRSVPGGRCRVAARVRSSRWRPARAGAAASRSATASRGRRAARPTRGRSAARHVRRRGRRAARAHPRGEQRSTLPAPRAIPARRTRPRGRGAHDAGAAPGRDSRADVDLAVLDGADAVADALRTANATRARRPEVPVIIAADTGGKSPSGVRVFDRWNETEELLQDIERLLSERVAGASAAGTVRLSEGLQWEGRRVAFVRETTKMRR